MALFPILHILITSALVGVIWVIQLVHYPSFAFVDTERWTAFHQHHTKTITFIVLPLMVTELGLVIYRAGWLELSAMERFAPLGLVVLIWASTFFVQVPLHNALATQKSVSLVQQLVQTNWVRTVAWTLELVLLFWALTKKLF